MRRRVSVVVLLVASACRQRAAAEDAATSASDFENFCFAAERSGSSGNSSPDGRATQVAQWIDAHLRTREVRDVFRRIPTVSCEFRARYFRAAMAEAGYHGACPMADELDRATCTTQAGTSAAAPSGIEAAARADASAIAPRR